GRARSHGRRHEGGGSSDREDGLGGAARRHRRADQRMNWRDVYCGELRADHVGREVTVAGWVARRRDHGGLVFIDLRDQAGVVQLVVNPEHAPGAHAAAHDVRNEFVLQATGEVAHRAPEAVNPNLATGEVEIQVTDLRIVSRSTTLPFQLDEDN